MPFDVEDVEPVANTSSSWVVVATRPDLPVGNLQEFIEYAKENPLTYASAGIGGITHICAQLFAMETGIEMTHVPYRGSGEALNALMGGHVDVDVDSNILPQLGTGSVKGIGYINDDPWPSYTEVRPLAEQGSTCRSSAGSASSPAKGCPGRPSMEWRPRSSRRCRTVT